MGKWSLKYNQLILSGDQCLVMPKIAIVYIIMHGVSGLLNNTDTVAAHIFKVKDK